MQQIFGLVNSFLTEDGETRKRRLSIRSYKVRVVVFLKVFKVS